MPFGFGIFRCLHFETIHVLILLCKPAMHHGHSKEMLYVDLEYFCRFFSCLFFFVDNRAPYDKHNVE